jgi:hypothetical protein
MTPGSFRLASWTGGSCNASQSSHGSIRRSIRQNGWSGRQQSQVRHRSARRVLPVMNPMTIRVLTRLGAALMISNVAWPQVSSVRAPSTSPMPLIACRLSYAPEGQWQPRWLIGHSKLALVLRSIAPIAMSHDSFNHRAIDDRTDQRHQAILTERCISFKDAAFRVKHADVWLFEASECVIHSIIQRLSYSLGT